MPRPHSMPRMRDSACPHIPLCAAPLLRLVLVLIALVLALPSAPAYAAPQLSLPTPPGETWKILQGYGCGSHGSWDRYSLDLVNADGRTRGAPVRAAADGTIWSWTGKSGTLILHHGGGNYTMYTHMASAVTTRKDHFVERGTVIGTVGDRGAPGTPHLHFTAFTGHGIAAGGRKSIPLSFVEGYDLPDIGGCNQHGGAKLTAGGERVITPAGVSFQAEVEPNRWYNTDLRIAFDVASAVGFSQAWNQEPNTEAPMFADATAGYVQLGWAGEGLHTLYVRAWGADGQQTLATYGPIGFDLTPPRGPAPLAPVEAAAGVPVPLHWDAAGDDGSGVAGYRVYIGADAAGTSDWFTPAPQVDLPALAPGSYLLRVQPLDYAGNAGEWATLGQIIVKG
jgi:hypothetical protein